MGSTFLRILISVAFLGFFAWSFRDNYHGVALAIRETDLVALAAGFAVILASTILMGWRLKLVFQAQGLKLSFKDATHLTFVGLFFNNFLPSAVGGDLVKAYCASVQTGQRMKTFSACLMDRIFGLFLFILIPAFAVLFLLKELDPRIPFFIGILLAVCCVGLLTIFNKHHLSRLTFVTGLLNKIPGMNHLGALYHAMHEMTRDKWLVIRICVISGVCQVMGFLSVWWIVHALSASIALHQLMIRTPLVQLFGMLPSFGGLGLREKGFEYFFKSSIGHECAGALAILYLFYLVLLSAIGGIVYLIRHDYHFSFKNIKPA